MDTSARLLRLLSLLQARPEWGGAELAERLGVTSRTLRRDVARLRALGYPVDAMPGRYGGYQLAAGGALPPLLLDDDEAVAVAVGLRAAAGAGAGLEDATVAALAKIEQVLPARLRERIAALHAATDRLGGAPGPRVDAEVLVLLAQACRRPERLRFGYRDGSGRVSERSVEPYRLVNTQRRWYLVARDRDRDDWRTFRVDRISDPVRTGMRFEPTDELDAVALVQEGLAVRAYRWQARILLMLPIEAAAQWVSPTVGVLEPAPGGTLLRIGGDELQWIAGYLAGLPCRFRIEDPPELVEAVRSVAGGLLQSVGE